MKKGILLLLGLIFLAGFVSAQGEVHVSLFYGQGCPHCASASEYLESLEGEYNLNVRSYETYNNQSNRELFYLMAEAYGIEVRGVPTIFIDDEYFIGFSDGVQGELLGEIEYCSSNPCEVPEDRLKKGEVSWERLSIPAVIAAAVVDAINPCAFAVLIILLTTVLASGKRKRALWAGVVFTLAIYISYFLMGLGLYSAIGFAGLTHGFYVVVAGLAILIGLFNLKDYFAYGKWFVMEVPPAWRPKMKGLIKGVTSVPGAFLIGFVVSLFLLPCTSGPYIVILGLLAQTATWSYAFGLLLLYNLVFILPMLVITLGVYWGFASTERLERWRQSKLQVLHLVAGLIILALGIGMLLSVYLGWI